jgi:dolichol-phosphate mannosyltransferase
MSIRKKISIIVPCYNEEAVIQKTYDTITQTMKKSDFDYEIIFCDDGSTDNTPHILEKLALEDTHVATLILSRNFGHQIASYAAIEYSKGDAVVLIDADLQDPPALILEMADKWHREKYDVIYAKRNIRKGESAFKKWTASLFYRLFNKVSEIKIPLDTGDFRLMDARVVDILKKMPEQDKFLRGMTSWIGLKQTAIYYNRDVRFAGVTKYPLRKMIKFAVSGIFSFSTLPLKIATWLGIAASIIAFLGIIYIFYIRLFMNDWVKGWAFTSVLILFFAGMQLLTLGILGQYVGLIYKQSKHRPLYVIDRIIKNNA